MENERIEKMAETDKVRLLQELLNEEVQDIGVLCYSSESGYRPK